MIHVTDSTFEKEVLKSKMLVVVDFYADWCGPCTMMTPSFEVVSKEITEVKFAKVNIDENPEHAGELGVMSIPCIILFKDGRDVERQVGAMTKIELVDWIKSHM